MERRSPVVSDRLFDLERKVSELEAKLDHARTTELEDHIDGIDRRAFAQLARHLEILVPGFSIVQFRAELTSLELEAIESIATSDLRQSMVLDALRARISEAITEMLPSSLYDGEDPSEAGPSAGRQQADTQP